MAISRNNKSKTKSPIETKSDTKTKPNIKVSGPNKPVNSKFHGFNEKEIEMIHKRFDKLSVNGLITKQNFGDSLGLLGLSHSSFLSDRIFDIIDEDGKGVANFDHFLKYMDTLLNGSEDEKAAESFKILDTGKKGKIVYEDIENMIYGISFLWNSMTGSKVIPSKDYMRKVMHTFDQDGDGVISLDDYKKVYSMAGDIFGWFDYFNQEDDPLSFKKKYGKPEIPEYVENSLKTLEKEITSCLSLLKSKSEKVKNESLSYYQLSNLHNMSMISCTNDSTTRRESNLGGPSIQSEQQIKKRGDVSPSEENEIGSFSYRKKWDSNSNSNPFFVNDELFDSINEFSESSSLISYQDLTKKLTNMLSLARSVKEGTPSKQENQYKIDNYYNSFLTTIPHDNDLKNNSTFKTSDINTRIPRYPNNNNTNSISHTKSHSAVILNKNSNSINYNDNENPASFRESNQYLKPQFPSFISQSPMSSLQKPIMGHDQSQNKQNLGLVPTTSSNITSTNTDNPYKLDNRRVTIKNMPGLRETDTDVRKNISVFFGHKKWNIVLNMMIGIRTSIKNIYPRLGAINLDHNEFKYKSKYDLVQRRTEKFDKRKACKFYDYAPHVFQNIRKKFGISDVDFLRSCGPENLLGSLIMGKISSLTELISSGKSGSFFYYSEDGKFMLKTVSPSEFEFLKKILKDYYNHLMNYDNTLINKIFGIYKMKFYKTKATSAKMYFIVMGNLFSTPLEIDIRYDLKGSIYGRTSRKPNLPQDKSIALKDMDFKEDGMMIKLTHEDKQIFLKQIEIDSKFFEHANIIDYSLLIGLHNIPKSNFKPELLNFRDFKTNSNLKGEYIKNQKEILLNDQPFANSKLKSENNNNNNLRFYERYQGGILSKDHTKIYLLGIIDILTEYSSKKKIEYGFKKTVFGSGISCVPPNVYADRFKAFITSCLE